MVRRLVSLLISLLLLAFALVLAAETPAAGQTTAALPLAVFAAGDSDASWHTDVLVLAPSPELSEVQWRLSSSADDGLGWQHQLLSGTPGWDLRSGTLSLSRQGGALLVLSETPLLVLGHAYSSTSRGSYGLLIPAVRQDPAAATDGGQVLPHLTHDVAYHSNIGLAETAGRRTPVVLELFDSSGCLLGVRYHTLEPYGWLQDNSVFAAVTAEVVHDGYAMVSSPDSHAGFLASATIVSNSSNDTDLVVAETPSAETRIVLAAVHLAGDRGTQWRSDLEVVNPGLEPATYRLELLSGERTPSLIASLGPGEAHRHRDVLHELFDEEGAAPLRIVPLDGEIVVTSRTYTLAGASSFGQMSPVLPERAAAEGEEQIWLPLMAQPVGSADSFRTNLGLVSLADSPVSFTVRLYHSNGRLLDTQGIDAQEHSLVQLHRVLADLDRSQRAAVAFAAVSCPTPEARFFAYAAMVNDRSGDPLIIPPLLLGQ